MIDILTLLLVTGLTFPDASGDAGPEQVPAPVRVVTTLGVYADITRALGGSEVEVSSIAAPNEDAHFGVMDRRVSLDGPQLDETGRYGCGGPRNLVEMPVDRDLAGQDARDQGGDPRGLGTVTVR